MPLFKKTNKFLLFPILIFLVLFFLDKLILLPYIQKCCVNHGLRIFFQDNFLNSLEEKFRKAKKENKKVAFNFGSSTSYGFYFSKSRKYLDAIPGCENNKICFHANWEIINLSTPGATVISHYIHLKHLLESGIQPDLILVELAPSSFNRNTPWYKSEILETMSFSYALRNFKEIPFDHLRLIFQSWLFASTKYNIGRYAESKNIARDYFKKFLFDMTMENKFENINTPHGTRVGEEGITDIASNDFILAILKNTFSHYTIDPGMKEYFDLIVKKTKDAKIPVVFWHPAIHPIAKEAMGEINSKETWKKFLKEIEQNKINYIDPTKNENYKCDRFIDTVHMGVECFGNLFSRAVKNTEVKAVVKE